MEKTRMGAAACVVVLLAGLAVLWVLAPGWGAEMTDRVRYGTLFAAVGSLASASVLFLMFVGSREGERA